mgnify:CR=1 FL=1
MANTLGGQEKVIVSKVLERKDGVKMVIVPKKCYLVKGDCVEIIKLQEGKR